MKKRIKKFLSRFYTYRYFAYKVHKRVVLKDPRKEANRAYSIYFKKKIDWNNPTNLIEKIYWLQFNTDTSLWTEYSDKYKVRDYIKKCGFESNLPKLYGKWNNSKDIDFDKLPDSFVLKTNNSCGTVLIVKDKSKLNLKSAVKQLDRWLSIKYGYGAAQLHYLKIKPCIIAEQLLTPSKEDTLISPNSLIDYKVYCINGEPQAIWVAYNRDHFMGVNMNIYDVHWNPVPEHLVSGDYYKYSEKSIPKPKCLHEMLEMSRQLSKPFCQVRIDFYIVNNKPIFGEMTFTTGTGFFSYDFYECLGSKIDLERQI